MSLSRVFQAFFRPSGGPERENQSVASDSSSEGSGRKEKRKTQRQETGSQQKQPGVFTQDACALLEFSPLCQFKIESVSNTDLVVRLLSLHDHLETLDLTLALTHIYTHSQVSETDPTMTHFHATRPPSISVRDYVARVLQYSPCSKECFILAVCLVDRVMQLNPKFRLCQLNVHRVILLGVLTATKFYDDFYYNNTFYAKVGGVTTAELNALEIDFLFLLNFNLQITPAHFFRYSQFVLALSKSPPALTPRS
eukprot:TRINITY_DN4132_c0_g1_i3.p1 TRINITY_DN4132_c0_g1~~TRINITY_DN4132_c0_g1_i3.p1  ORF type:complete len:253 (-),score=48.59 TRINITY_DN4132_c0_g1_i3:34-792(-)